MQQPLTENEVEKKANVTSLWISDKAVKLKTGRCCSSKHRHYSRLSMVMARSRAGFQARSKDQEILEEGDGAGPSLLPRRDHE